ncbi:MAG TPA: hypothetical protein VF062_17070 [Candidatus Limnocylindrales bacterium]
MAKVDWETPFSTVRVHVWPSALRVVFPAHPPVHSHDRHITSFVLGGQYEDVLYRVEPAIASDSKAVQRYDVRKPPARGAVSGDTLVASDEFVCVSELERRLVPAHAWHAIPAGVAHETLMTTGQFCVTLAVKGAPLGHGWEFVVDQPGLPERLISRRQLTDQERMEVWKEVVPHLESVLEDSSFD